MLKRVQAAAIVGCSLLMVGGMLTEQAAAVGWVGGYSDNNWNDPNNWDTGWLPDVDFNESADFTTGDLANITADLDYNPRHIQLDGGTINQSAGLVSLTNGGLNLGENLEDAGPSYSEYNLTGGELRVAAAKYTDINIGLRVDSGSSALNVSGTAFLNQVGIDSAIRGIRVGRYADGTLLLTDSAHVYTKGLLQNGGENLAGIGTVSIFGGGIQIDADGGYRQDEVSILDLHVDGTGISPVNTILDAVLNGFLQIDFASTPTIGDSYTIIDAATAVTGTFAGGVTATGLAEGQGVSVNYAGGTDGFDVVLSVVEWVGLNGDYNENGVVDAADYTVWCNAMSAGATTLANDPTPGSVDESDYTYWKDHFGEAAPTGAGTIVAAVPEPSSLLLAAGGLALMLATSLRAGKRTS